jgi:AraC-like DNA-binding protein
MPASGTSIFTDPDAYESGFPGGKISLVFISRGDFKARLTWVDLPNMRLLCGEENLPHVAYLSLAPKRVCVAFPTHLDAPMTWAGVELRCGDIILNGPGDCAHVRTRGTSHLAFMFLAPEYLAHYGQALMGLDAVPLPMTRVVRPPSCTTRRLIRLHAKACRLAESKPKVIAHREVARALEHDLLHILVDCLSAGFAHNDLGARRRRAHIMNRFEDLLASHFERPLQISEICASIGVPERTLRACCAQFLGMGPSRYIRLRRAKLVRAALLRADPKRSTIAEHARRYGFSEPGRFSALYRTVFGETPSTTLRRAAARDATAAERK